MNFLPIRQRVLGYVVFLFVFATQGLMGYWAFWPYVPARVDSIEIVKFINGEEFVYRVRGEKFKDLPADLTRQFIDGFTVTLPTASGNVDVGKINVLSKVPIPKLPPGSYYFKWSATYKVNPIRQETITARTICFDVVK